jgi:hypothetical protein
VDAVAHQKVGEDERRSRRQRGGLAQDVPVRGQAGLRLAATAC